MNLIFKTADVHPTIRPTIEKEVARINAQTPPLPGNLVFGKLKEEYWNRGNQHKRIEGYAVTTGNPASHRVRIALNPDCFGMNSNLERLNELIEGDVKAGFHGSMRDPAYILAHEYGHALENMLSRKLYNKKSQTKEEIVWSVKTKAQATPEEWKMIEAYKALVEYGGEGVMLGFIKQTGMLPQSLQKEFDRYYPTGYSSSSPNEFFAETYALRFYGNEAEKNHPAVKLMDALLKTIYPTLN